MTNPSFPRIEEAIALGQGGAQGAQPFHHWLDITRRSIQQNTLTRGKQYELDEIQPGEYDLTLDNTDGYFDPTNSSSPYYPQVLPWVGYRKRAQWPVTNNLLSPEYSTTEGLTATPTWLYYGSGVTVSIAQDIPNAWQGTNAYQAAIPSGWSNVVAPVEWGELACIPGDTYTFSVYVTDVTASTTATLVAQIITLDASNNVIARNSGTPATLTGATGNTNYTRLTVTTTIPSNCAGILLGVNFATLPSTTPAATFLFDGLQLELASSASSWAAGGEWYSLFSGFVERWPQTWDMSGTRSLITPTCVDQLAWLSQADLPNGLLAAIQGPSSGQPAPDFVYTFSDTSGSTSFIDAQGSYSNATIQGGGTYGNGVITPGTAVTAVDLPNGLWAAGGQTVTNIAVGSGGTPGSGAAGPYSGIVIPRNQATGKYGPQGTAATGWTRMIAFRQTDATAAQTIWDAESPSPLGATLTNQIAVYTYAIDTSSNQMRVEFVLTLNGTTVFNAAYDGAPLGDWTLIFFGVGAGGSTAFFSGHSTTQLRGLATQAISIPWNNQEFGIDIIGVSANSSRASYNVLPFVGDVAYACEWPYALNITQMGQIWDFWSGEVQSTDQRYAGILNILNYQGPRSLDSGITRDMGPALDIADEDALTALQGCVLAEAGQQYVSSSGVLTFKNRQARMNQTPVLSFGDSVANSEIPFEDLQVDFDDTQVINDSQITQYSSNNVYYGENVDSKTLYGIRTNQTTINVVNPQECQDLANGQSLVFGSPQPHVTAITIYPNRILHECPNAWADLLSLELGMCVSVAKRTVGRQAFGMAGFVEQIQWNMSPGDASVTLQITNSAFSQYWQMAAMYTTLDFGIPAGSTSFTFNAIPVPNSLAAGMSVELDPGTPVQETVTIASVAGNSVTLVNPTQYAHSGNAVLCDVLPSGVTDPSTWDAFSVLDSTTILSY